MTLYQLSKTILLLNKAPINKVRFARVVYFVHKELIRKKFMSPEDIAYIRSPLGPVPEGLLQLSLDHPNIVTNLASGRPSFAAEEYTLNPTDAEQDEEITMLEQYREVLKATERTLKALAVHTTSELVRVSHTDPSWIAHFNGTRYFITPADLKNPFPFNTIRVKIRIKRPTQNELGALQANLLRGMINDIVKESTDLEYPDQPTANNQQKPKPTKSLPKLNPLDIIAALPFLKHINTQKSPITNNPKDQSTAKTAPTINNHTTSETTPSSQTSPKNPEQTPNDEQEGTK